MRKFSGNALAFLLLLLTGCSSSRPDVIIVREIIYPPTGMNDNPFFSESTLPFQAPDFHSIQEDDYLPAFEEGMRRHAMEVDSIANNPEPPTFENTIEALEKSGEILRRVQRVFFNMTSAHTSGELQRIQAEMAPKLSSHWDDILLNRKLFERIGQLYNRRGSLGLDEADLKLLEDNWRDFVRAGARLSEEDQQRMRHINERLSSLTTEFQEKLLEMTRERAVLVQNEEELAGLSPDRIAASALAARQRGEEGWLLNLTNTTRQPVLASLENRELRRRVWEASAWRGRGENGGVDTRPLVLEMVRLRAEKASLLGYPDWASYILERQTAEQPEAALEMMTGLLPAVRQNMEREAEEIRRLLREDGHEQLMPWDWEFYAEKVRKEKYEVDEEEVRPWFELDRVLREGVFYTLNRLYGISFEERDDLPVYHPDVRVFTVKEADGENLGLLYVDLFERDSKRGGAWMSSFVSQSRLLEREPVVLIVLNIPPPAEGDPVLVPFDHVTTLFHEIGHAVHGLFSDVKWPSQSGTAVPRDFVEFPSTFMEDWAIHPEVISRYALHHETGESIPSGLLERLIRARTFNQGFDTQEYLAAALIDMEWHTLPPDRIPDDVEAFEESVLQKYGLDVEAVPPRYYSTFFSHLFAGGYSASYYAYIWSEVLAADAFAFMNEEGGLTRENGDRLRNAILSRGGSRDARSLWLDYRGREPDPDHLLRRRGLEPGSEGGRP